MKCQVEWINSKGQFTPDNNDAVMMAHFHEPIWGFGTTHRRHIEGYGAIRDSFPICADHYAMVDDSYKLPRGGWSFTPLPIYQEKSRLL